MAIKYFRPPEDFLYHYLTSLYYRKSYGYDQNNMPVMFFDRFDPLKGTYTHDEFPLDAYGQVSEEVRGWIPKDYPPLIQNMLKYPSRATTLGTLAAAGISRIFSLILLGILLG